MHSGDVVDEITNNPQYTMVSIRNILFFSSMIFITNIAATFL